MPALNSIPYRDAVRLLIILYVFSEPYEDPEDEEIATVFDTEVRLQKLDFLLRYPSFVCHELLNLHEETGTPSADEAKLHIRRIFQANEPRLRTEEMRRFFYGAYEELDSVLAFLRSRGLLKFRSRRTISGGQVEKKYLLTHASRDRIRQHLVTLASVGWYLERCLLLKQYFGHMLGSELKDRQYRYQQYQNTRWGGYISNEHMDEDVRHKFLTIFGENL
jgi:hypothetical protein